MKNLQEKKIKEGDFVEWEHTPAVSRARGKTFLASGKVIKIYKSGTGGNFNNAKVAKIKLDDDEYWARIKRETTTISISKLRIKKP